MTPDERLAALDGLYAACKEIGLDPRVDDDALVYAGSATWEELRRNLLEAIEERTRLYRIFPVTPSMKAQANQLSTTIKQLQYELGLKERPPVLKEVKEKPQIVERDEDDRMYGYEQETAAYTPTPDVIDAAMRARAARDESKSQSKRERLRAKRVEIQVVETAWLRRA